MTPEAWFALAGVVLVAVGMLVAGVTSHVTLKAKLDTHRRDIERLQGEVGGINEVRVSIATMNGQLTQLNGLLARWLEPPARSVRRARAGEA